MNELVVYVILYETFPGGASCCRHFVTVCSWLMVLCNCYSHLFVLVLCIYIVFIISYVKPFSMHNIV